jgi:hypothetical protein
MSEKDRGNNKMNKGDYRSKKEYESPIAVSN